MILFAEKQRVDPRLMERVKLFLPEHLLTQITVQSEGIFMIKDAPRKIINELGHLSSGEKAMVRIALDILVGDNRKDRVSCILDLWLVNKECRSKIISTLE